MLVARVTTAAAWMPPVRTEGRALAASRPGAERGHELALLRGQDDAGFSEDARALARTAKAESTSDREGATGDSSGSELSPEEQEKVRELAARDRDVRAHEQAHKAAAGQLATGPSYSYERGPDGKGYAVDGEVRISVREGDTPEETLRLAQQAQRAAQAPGELSAADQAVAAKAAAMATEARKAIQEERREEQAEQKRAWDANGARSPARLAARSLDIIA